MFTFKDIVEAAKASPIFVMDDYNSTLAYKISDRSDQHVDNSAFLAMRKKKQLIRSVIESENTHDINLFRTLLSQGTKAFIVDAYFDHDSCFQEELSKFIEENRNNLDFIVKVESSDDALYALARHHLRKIRPMVIAVTGSVGKTSTVEMIAAILKSKGKTHKSSVYNTFYAISKSIMSMPEDTDFFVVETSTRRTGIMRRNSWILEPDVAVITQIKYEHVKGMGSLDGIAKEKLSLTESMNASGLLVCPNIPEIKRNALINFGGDMFFANLESTCDEVVTEAGSSFTYKGDKFFLPSPGKHNIHNALLAIVVCRHLGCSAGAIREGLSVYKAVGNRWNAEAHDHGIVIINDSPNNPSHATILSALQALDDIYPNHRKIVLLSDILELGNFEEELYRDIGKKINESSVDHVILYGSTLDPLANEIDTRNTTVRYFKKTINEPIKFRYNGELTNYIGTILRRKTVLLVKASRIMGFGEVARHINRFVKEKYVA